MALQIIKIKKSGETWVERSPFNPEGLFLNGTVKNEEQEEEEEEEEEVPAAESLSSISDVSQEDEPTKQVQPVEQGTTPTIGVEVSMEEEGSAESQHAESSKTIHAEEEPSAEVAVATRKIKMARRRVVLNVPADKKDKEEEGEGGERGGVVLRRNQHGRSKTVSAGGTSAGAIALRRQSLVLLQQGKTGEKGSRRFRAALRRDSVYEGHPGWESIRKLSVVVG